MRLHAWEDEDDFNDEDDLEDEDFMEEEFEEEEALFFFDDLEETIHEEPKNPGFFATLFAGLDAEKAMKGRGNLKKHNGRCDGDCANCPPHYGYRYGRWYYGHHHSHGCEIGGCPKS